MNKNEVIIATALNMFVENGFHGTATSKIAQQAGVANGTLFNYFATKEILIVSIYNDVVKKLDDFIIQSLESSSVSKESFRSLFVASLQWNLENKLEFQFLQLFNNSPYSRVAITKVTSEEEHPLYVLIKNGIDLVILKPIPVALVFSLFNAQINGLYHYLISNNINKDQSALWIEETFELLWKMIVD
ncbi:TetR/AcrR family transcriptional regulator [Flavobacterium sp. 5]|uniref:TetR/AcrR family transcriptional regulator n=1 Tax=Flavobacterium sp. 5 TaxID=2035199 RepID=UPI000C2C9E39|nr:TetR/AcrR family transcriptional regulator [Flavobacterium sp. 5]PKB16708.1 TetR family transcriptional regulator [Flavobacterium sp. 5]